MAHRIADFDWSSTSIGEMSNWTQSLQTALGICLASPVPTFVWWGPELIHIYNDAYAPLLGDRHPGALGAPARKVWADIWEMIADDVEAVIDHGASVVREQVRFVLKRKGFPDEMFFTYTLSPIPDGKGGVGGIFQVAIDETARVLAERERRQTQELEQKRWTDATASAEANVARWQAVIANMAEGIILTDPQGNLLDWNRAALRMHGYSSPQDVPAHLTDIANAFEVVELSGAPVPFEQWPLSRVLRGEVVRNHQAHVHVRSSGKNLVLIYNGTLIRDTNGNVRLALLTLHDATEAHRLQSVNATLSMLSRFSKIHSAHREKRTAIEAANTVDSLLYDMDLSLREREFCKALGERFVQEAIEAYLKTTQRTKGYDGSCIAASLAVAMIIVNDL